MAKVFVTGATGMVGANLVRRLVQNKDEVTILVRKTSSHPFLDGLKVKRAYGDLGDFDSVKRGMKGSDYVYHLAGYISYNKKDRKKLFDINTSGTRKVMKAALDLKIKKVVHCSSTAALGIGDSKGDILTEESEFSPRFKKIGYMYSKKLAEDEVLKAHQEGLNVCLVNPTSIMGAGDEKMNSGALFKNIKDNRLKAATPGGNSIVAVSDVVEGLMLAMEKGRSGRRYILNSQNIEYIDLFNIIAKVINSNKIKRKIPKIAYFPLVFVAMLLEKIDKKAKLTPEVLFFSFRFRYFDSSRAKKELGWIPEQDLEVTVREAADYYKKRGMI
ncbi:MAG: NAD-dependent epimerase/dehydratase family protein [Candidatus Aminicenantes bacterium]|nr:NAD-dependent epimerase/dehydratase family protein [Candidatus Aminicenantes bacterium]